MTSQFFSGSISVRVLGSLVALLVASGCSGSLNASASAKASSDGEADANLDAEGDAAWDQVDESQTEQETDANAKPSTPQAVTPRAEMALLGARHDLMVARGAPTPCACLAVAIGQPNSAQLVWTGKRPTTDPNNQTVIALGSDGIPCTESGPGASYMGYVKNDGNVIVTVEAAVAGRPVTHGAIIPKPDQGKQIFLKPAGKIPYGKGPNGEAQCALGPGQ